ncbi:MAG: rhodanese-like domain-containing protein [Candidatus Eisenbacteria bacterium]
MIDRTRRARTVPAVGLFLFALLTGGCASGPHPGESAGSGTAAYVQHLSADQVDSWVGIHYDGLVLDVGSPAEWDDAIGHLDNAVPVPIEDLESRLGEFERYRSGAVLVYDRNGTRTTRAGQILVTHGFHEVSALDGGLKAYRDWQQAR